MNQSLPNTRFSRNSESGIRGAYCYGFNGKELDKEETKDEYDFGSRQYMPTLGRFFVPDLFEKKFSYQSSYSAFANCPILCIDFNGDSIWVTTVEKSYVDASGRTVIERTHTINVTVKILDTTGNMFRAGSGCTGRIDTTPEFATALQNFMNTELKGTWDNTSIETASQTVKETYKWNIVAKAVDSMAEVEPSDHLIVIVDDVLGKADEALGGGEAGGLGKMNGKVSYIEYEAGSLKSGKYNFNFNPNMLGTAVHEMGHNFGLSHEAGSRNVMNYNQPWNSNFLGWQYMSIVNNCKTGSLNQGNNYEYMKKDVNIGFFEDFTSTNLTPFNSTQSKGDKIPLTLGNN